MMLSVCYQSVISSAEIVLVQFVKEFQVVLMPALSLSVEVYQQRFSSLLQIWADIMFPLNNIFSYENDVHNQYAKTQNLLVCF